MNTTISLKEKTIQDLTTLAGEKIVFSSYSETVEVANLINYIKYLAKDKTPHYESGAVNSPFHLEAGIVKFREKTGDTNRGNINMYGGTFSLLTNLW
jgi:hypothetical protein